VWLSSRVSVSGDHVGALVSLPGDLGGLMSPGSWSMRVVGRRSSRTFSGMQRPRRVHAGDARRLPAP